MGVNRLILICICLVALLFVVQTLPKTGWTAQAGNVATDIKIAAAMEETGGRGEGLQTEKEAKQKTKKEEKEECPSTFGPLITDTAIPIETGKITIQPYFILGFTTNNFSQSWRHINAGGNFHSFSTPWRFVYGPMKNLEVYLIVPFYIHNWAGSVDTPGPNGERSANFGGLGDISLTFKYRLVEETETLPTISAYFTPTFPSGHASHLNPRFLGTDVLGCGSYVFTPGINMSKWVKPFIFYANFWYSMQTANDNGASDNGYNGRQYPRDFVTVNLAAEYPITEKWVACFEYVSYFDGGRLFGHQANVAPGALISLIPEIEYMATDKFALALGMQYDVAGKNNAANITPILSMTYTF